MRLFKGEVADVAPPAAADAEPSPEFSAATAKGKQNTINNEPKNKQTNKPTKNNHLPTQPNLT